MRRAGLAACLLALLAPCGAAAQELAAALGKQRAAASKIEWEPHEAGHPRLGNITFAYNKELIQTPAGNGKVFSRAYLSCQKATHKFAIELTNTTAPDDPSGLQPAETPRIVCVRPTGPAQQVQEEILANWDVDPKLGDALTQGLRAFPLRECVAIRVEQQVALPASWAQKSVKVEFEILPYNRTLDAVFAACGERSAYAPSTPTVAASSPAKPAPATTPAKPQVAAAAPPKSTPPAPASSPAPAALTTPVNAAPVAAPPPAVNAQAGWQMARVLPSGKTNVRAGPRIESSIVAQLDPGAVVLVQRTGNEWWRARPANGTGFDGYIREDRLSFK